MTFEIGLVLGLLGLAVLCFSFEWIPAEVVAMGLMLAFAIWGVLTPAPNSSRCQWPCWAVPS